MTNTDVLQLICLALEIRRGETKKLSVSECAKEVAKVIRSLALKHYALIYRTQWFGHSSYFLQVDGVQFFVDPVFSGNASPIPNGTKAFKGTNNYRSADMPHFD